MLPLCFTLPFVFVTVMHRAVFGCAASFLWSPPAVCRRQASASLTSVLLCSETGWRSCCLNIHENMLNNCCARSSSPHTETDGDGDDQDRFNISSTFDIWGFLHSWSEPSSSPGGFAHYSWEKITLCPHCDFLQSGLIYSSEPQEPVLHKTQWKWQISPTTQIQPPLSLSVSVSIEI